MEELHYEILSPYLQQLSWSDSTPCLWNQQWWVNSKHWGQKARNKIKDTKLSHSIGGATHLAIFKNVDRWQNLYLEWGTNTTMLMPLIPVISLNCYIFVLSVSSRLESILQCRAHYYSNIPNGVLKAFALVMWFMSFFMKLWCSWGKE